MWFSCVWWCKLLRNIDVLGIDCLVVLMYCTLWWLSPERFLQYFFKFHWGYLKNHLTNTRLVCTHSAFFMLNPNMAKKVWFQKILKKSWKILACRLHSTSVWRGSMYCTLIILAPYMQILLFCYFFGQNDRGYLKNCWPKTRFVCTQIECIFHVQICQWKFTNLKFYFYLII